MMRDLKETNWNETLEPLPGDYIYPPTVPDTLQAAIYESGLDHTTSVCSTGASTPSGWNSTLG
jgi:hypothetical protein